jgi:membrane protease YdiL (CAAX protease family)
MAATNQFGPYGAANHLDTTSTTADATSPADGQSRASRWGGAALAGALSALVVSIYFSPWYFYPNPKHWLTANLFLSIAGTAAGLGAGFTAIRPRYRAPLVRVLTITAFIYLTWRLAIPWLNWLSALPLTTDQHYWVSKGPGGGVLGLLPTTLAVLVGGYFLFGVPLREQWNGRLRFALRDIIIGGGVGVGASVLTLACAALAGPGVYWAPNWAGHGVNVFSNLYEEVLARGVLLQVARRAGGNWFGMIWTGLVFGSMHGVNWLALGFAVVTWIIAWVVLRAGSLWAGWVFHQTIDVLVDSFLHQ